MSDGTIYEGDRYWVDRFGFRVSENGVTSLALL